MNADCICFGDIAEWLVVRGPSVNPHWNCQRQTLAASLLPKFVHPASQGENGLPSPKVARVSALGNSTCVQVVRGAAANAPKHPANFRAAHARMSGEF